MNSALTPLSSNEEIALRRIAHGSSVGVPARLQDLALIQRTNEGYHLAPLGQLRYEALPKAPLLSRPRSIDAVIGYVEGLIEKAQVRARSRTSAGRGERQSCSVGRGANGRGEFVSDALVASSDPYARHWPWLDCCLVGTDAECFAPTKGAIPSPGLVG